MSVFTTLFTILEECLWTQMIDLQILFVNQLEMLNVKIAMVGLSIRFPSSSVV